MPAASPNASAPYLVQVVVFRSMDQPEGVRYSATFAVTKESFRTDCTHLREVIVYAGEQIVKNIESYGWSKRKPKA